MITANSPASQGARPSNWKSVLWHEFCHVITLTKTNNRMPRWLSEGISVYEERLRDPRWGQSMTARYREMILGDDFTPVSKLSGAFLSPPSSTHLQFAYYESSLVVQYLVQEHGEEKLNGVLNSLADGIPINDALALNIGSIERLEVGFAEFARNLANEFGKDLQFTRHGLPEDAPKTEILKWAKENPDNYWARMTSAQAALAQGQFKAAAEHLEFLVSKNSATAEQEGVLELLAMCYRELGDEMKERATLETLFSLSPDALPSLERFIQMEKKEQNWSSVLESAARALEIQPFASGLHQSIADACRELEQSDKAIDSLLALQAMDPVDVAGLQYQLAESFAAAGQTDSAKEHLVDALLLAPRYRDAHHLLLTLSETQKPQPVEKPQPAEDSSAENSSVDRPTELEVPKSAPQAKPDPEGDSSKERDSNDQVESEEASQPETSEASNE